MIIESRYGSDGTSRSRLVYQQGRNHACSRRCRSRLTLHGRHFVNTARDPMLLASTSVTASSIRLQKRSLRPCCSKETISQPLILTHSTDSRKDRPNSSGRTRAVANLPSLRKSFCHLGLRSFIVDGPFALMGLKIYPSKNTTPFSTFQLVARWHDHHGNQHQGAATHAVL